MRFIPTLLISFAVVTLAACAPATTNRSGSNPVERLALKGSDVWTMTAYRPGSNDPSTFALELTEDPAKADDDDYYVAEARAGKFDALVFFFPEDDSIGVLVRLDRNRDPQVVLCTFDSTSPNVTRFRGDAYIGALSGLSSARNSDFGRCDLNKGGTSGTSSLAPGLNTSGNTGSGNTGSGNTGSGNAGPAAPSTSVLERFAIKGSDQWTLEAAQGSRTAKHTFELVEDPALSSNRQFFVAEALAGKLEASVAFFPSDNTISVFVLLDKSSDPELVWCVFRNTAATGTRFTGTSFFGKRSATSGVKDADLGRCTLTKGKI